MHATLLSSQARIVPILRVHGLLITLVTAMSLVTWGMVATTGSNTGSEMVSALLWNFAAMLPAMAYFLLIGRFIYVRYVIKPENQLRWFVSDVRSTVTDQNRLLTGTITFAIMVIFFLSFAHLKRLIPIVQPFAWDEAFMRLDQALHFGLHPYELAHAVFGHPLMLTAVTGAYNFWMFVMYFVLIATCFTTRNPRLKLQYLVAFVLTWSIAGNLMAMAFSSAGPVYYARLGLGDVYEPLMTILHNHAALQHITVVETQDLLWTLYDAPQSLNGISAMPSMHVASTVLMACYAFRFGRWPGIAFSAFASIIMLGSVLLAWHYAVDGYVGALIAILVWRLSGWLVALDLWRIPESMPDSER